MDLSPRLEGLTSVGRTAETEQELSDVASCSPVRL